MRKIRRSMFETNSSSVHSIVIGDSLPDDLVIPNKLEVCYMEKGRNFDYSTVQTRYTAAVLMAHSRGRLTELIEKLHAIGIKEKVLSIANTDSQYDGYGIEMDSLGEIDPDAEEQYLDEILESEDSLKCWLFSSNSSLSGEDDNEIW